MVDIASAIALERSDGSGSDLLYWARATMAAIEAYRADHEYSAETAASREAGLLILEDAFRTMAMAMEFGFLFDRSRQLVSIGFLISESALDPNCYDLLASEARLASFFAIAKGDLPARHWFRLGRAATASHPRHGVDLLIGFNVRISHAAACHARAHGELAGGDGSARPAPPDRIWGKTGIAVGHFRIRLQRP